MANDDEKFEHKYLDIGPRVVVHPHILWIAIPLRSNASDATSLNISAHAPTVVIQPIKPATIPIGSRVCSASNVAKADPVDVQKMWNRQSDG